MSSIKNIIGEKILDSKKRPAIKVTVMTDDGSSGSFAVPSGTSTGKFEAHEITDIDLAIQNIETKILPALKGIEVADQTKIDQTMIELDGTENKSNLGGNTIIGVSVACSKAAAESRYLEVYQYLRTLLGVELPLGSSTPKSVPLLFMNLIEGGKHVHPTSIGFATVPIQEYHVVPQTDSIEEAIEMGQNIFKYIQNIKSASATPDEGGVPANAGETLEIDDVFTPLKLLHRAVEECGYAGKVKYAIDAAASSFYNNGKYNIGKQVSKEKLMEIYRKMINEYDVFSIEDPFEENDISSFHDLLTTHRSRPVGSEVYVVGDDLTVTNPSRLQKAIDERAINAIIIKPNQVGTLTETLETMKLARENNIECIISHRSGETMDDFIADLAYAFGCFGLKSGAPTQPERMAKYNRLLKISKS